MHHCDVLCLVLLLCVLCKPIIMLNTFTIFYCVCAINSTSPPTHFTQAPPSLAKNRYLNSRLMILHASELATELFDEAQSPRCTLIATAKLPAWSRHVHGITQYKMASNIQLTTGRDLEIAGLILLFR